LAERPSDPRSSLAGRTPATPSNEIIAKVEESRHSGLGRRSGRLSLDFEALVRFAHDADQTWGGEFFAVDPGADPQSVDRADSSGAAFEAGPIRYILWDVRGDEWVLIARRGRRRGCPGRVSRCPRRDRRSVVR
jgi:hypothetical protein